MASKTDRFSDLPGWPLMLSDQQAAKYVSLTPAKFQLGVRQGELPRPRLLAGQQRWSRLEIDEHLHQSLTAPGEDFDPISAAIDDMRIA
jgi:predicted DNA-binding transcriptional regulator AlpA